MSQLSIFNEPVIPHKNIVTQWQLFVDGAARNNPGPAGAGIYLLQGDKVAAAQGFYLGKKTNNQAEYMALLLGLCEASALMKPQDLLSIFSDSELLIRQVEGRYAVKNKELRILHDRAKKLLAHLSYTVKHVLREQNSQADALANAGIDKKVPVPKHLVHMCHLE